MGKPTIAITGGTSGIGHATAALMHRRGHRVLATGSSAVSVAAARNTLDADIRLMESDSRRREHIEDLAGVVEREFGELDALFLNAGISRPSPLGAVNEATFDDVFDVNVKGQFFTLQRLSPLLKDGGSVVLNVGIGATRGAPGVSVTFGSKGALLSMVPTLALELAPRRIRVNAVSPSSAESEIFAKAGLPPQLVAELNQTMQEGTPLGRLGTGDDIAECVAFLVSSAAEFITGQNIVIGGGAGLSAF